MQRHGQQCIDVVRNVPHRLSKQVNERWHIEELAPKLHRLDGCVNRKCIQQRRNRGFEWWRIQLTCRTADTVWQLRQNRTCTLAASILNPWQVSMTSGADRALLLPAANTTKYTGPRRNGFSDVASDQGKKRDQAGRCGCDWAPKHKQSVGSPCLFGHDSISRFYEESVVT